MKPFHRSSALRIENLDMDGILRSAENEADKWFRTCSIAGEEERNVRQCAPFGREITWLLPCACCPCGVAHGPCSSSACNKINLRPDCVSTYKQDVEMWT